MVDPRPLGRPQLLYGLLLIAALVGCGTSDDEVSVAEPTTTTALATTTTTEAPNWRATTGALSYELIDSYPHDPAAFTQGLELIEPGVLIESTGLRGQSERRIVELDSGEVRASVGLDPEEFGEGITQVDDRFVQLTWQSGAAIVSDAVTLEETARFNYDTEGWGLCLASDGRLIHSDGSSTLQFRDPDTFEVVDEITVTLNGEALAQLNELECVDGMVLANVWQTTQFVLIDIGSGQVSAVVDLADLVPESVADDASAVLNGIAYDADDDTFLVTGKKWPTLYRIRLTAP